MRLAGWTQGLDPSDGRTTVGLISQDWNPDFGEPDLTVAHTSIRYDTDTGEIFDADVYLNGVNFSFERSVATAFDTESVVLHELGHTLGFAHSCGDPGRTYPSCFSVPDDPPGQQERVLEAVMAPTLAPGVQRRALTIDEREALASHYGGDPQRPAIRLSALQRRCPSGDLVVDLSPVPEQPQALLRHADGRRVPLEVLEVLEGQIIISGSWDVSGSVDLLVHPSAESERYGALIDVQAAACEAPPPPPSDMEEGGCSCAHLNYRQSRNVGGTLVILFVMLGFGSVRALRRRGLLTLLGCFVLLSLLPSSAMAFRCSRVGVDFGPSLIWGERVIPWYADANLWKLLEDEAAAEAEIMASFEAWENVPCSDLEFPLAAVVPNLRAGFSETDANRNVVVQIAVGWPYEPGAIAVTTSAYDTRTGLVVDADIEINNEEFDFVIADDTCDPERGTMDIRNALTHEVGHVVGLEHPPNAPRYAATTMFASAPSCETQKRTLAEDDVDGICSIYPLGNPTQQCFLPDGPSFAQVAQNDGFEQGCTHIRSERNARRPWWLLGLALLLLRRGARRRTPQSS